MGLNVTFGALACCLACVALGLVCAWAQYTPNQQLSLGNNSYLGRPSWKTNPFAWHPVFMVAGFFFSQVLSLSALVFLEDKSKAFFTNLFWQAAAICTLIAGLRAIVKFKYDTGYPAPYATEDSLITLHSWIGVLAIIFFALLNLYGLPVGIMGIVQGKKFASQVTFTHMSLSVLTLALTAISIVSGVAVYNGEFGCDALGTNPDKTSINPASEYHRLPWACKLSNGLGVSVLLAATCIVLALLFSRSVAIFDDSNQDEEENQEQPAPAGKGELELVEKTEPKEV